MDQALIHLQSYDYNDLVDAIQQEMSSRYEDGYFLADIQYFNMENNTSSCDAFLLFNEVRKGECE